MMSLMLIVLQLVIALGILNVWLVRFGRPTAWRGGDARNMREEFAAYGLPGWAVGTIGSLKVLAAVALIAGIWVPAVTKPAAAGLAWMMAGAIVMHVRVKDPARKSLPATAILALCVLVIAL